MKRDKRKTYINNWYSLGKDKLYKNYKIIALVPARGGSKGIKLKNLKKINNQTLLK